MSVEQYLIPIEHGYTHTDRKMNICADCAYPIPKCSWLHEGKPVSGWRAEKSVVRFARGKNGKVERYPRETWHITGCPLFKAYPPERAQKQDGTDRGYNTLRTFYE